MIDGKRRVFCARLSIEQLAAGAKLDDPVPLPEIVVREDGVDCCGHCGAPIDRVSLTGNVRRHLDT